MWERKPVPYRTVKTAAIARTAFARFDIVMPENTGKATSFLERRKNGRRRPKELQISTHIHLPRPPSDGPAIMPLGLFLLYSTAQPQQSYEAEIWQSLRNTLVETIDLLSQLYALAGILQQHAGHDEATPNQWQRKWRGELLVSVKGATGTLKDLQRKVDSRASVQDPYVLVRIMPTP